MAFLTKKSPRHWPGAFGLVSPIIRIRDPGVFVQIDIDHFIRHYHVQRAIKQLIGLAAAADHNFGILDDLAAIRIYGAVVAGCKVQGAGGISIYCMGDGTVPFGRGEFRIGFHFIIPSFPYYNIPREGMEHRGPF